MFNNKEKRGRGRPRKEKIDINKKKRGAGRPRKHHILEGEVYLSSDGQKKIVTEPVLKKVDQNYLFEQVMNYLVKVNLIHQTLYEASKGEKPIFSRLKELDFQMIDICKSVLNKQ